MSLHNIAFHWLTSDFTLLTALRFKAKYCSFKVENVKIFHFHWLMSGFTLLTALRFKTKYCSLKVDNVKFTFFIFIGWCLVLLCWQHFILKQNTAVSKLKMWRFFIFIGWCPGFTLLTALHFKTKYCSFKVENVKIFHFHLADVWFFLTDSALF